MTGLSHNRVLDPTKSGLSLEELKHPANLIRAVLSIQGALFFGSLLVRLKTPQIKK